MLANHTEDTGVTLSEKRERICLEVAWELDALARLLPGLVPNIEEAHGAHHAVRGIAGRFLRLAEALMGAVQAPAYLDEHLEQIVSLKSPGQG